MTEGKREQGKRELGKREQAGREQIGRDELRQLRDEAEPPCVSLYLPVNPARPETQGNVIRLKNLLRQAEEGMLERGVARERCAEVLAPARELLDDTAFWQQPGEGLAIFLAPGVTRVQRTPVPLPERALVGDRFHFAPLLPMLSGDGRFHVLALSQNGVRLFEASRDGVEELQLAGVPRSLQEALQVDEVQAPLQFHAPGGAPQATAMRASGRGPGAAVRGGRRTAMFHGHGASEEDEKESLLRFLQVLDDRLMRHLRRRPLPLVVAAVDYEQAMFREVSSHPELLPDGIDGNPELLSGEELRDRALPLVEPVLQADLQRAVATFDELGGSDRVSCDLEDVLLAAVDGRVDTLFADVSRQRWGRFDPESRTVVVHEDREPSDEDLIDRAAAEALDRGGCVFGLSDGGVPGGGPVAAVFRY